LSKREVFVKIIKMYGGPFNNNAGGLEERITDNWINQNVPGGVNSKS
jgi:hypothetical protein